MSGILRSPYTYPYALGPVIKQISIRFHSEEYAAVLSDRETPIMYLAEIDIPQL